MKLKTVFKITLAVGLLLLSFSATSYAASITSVSGTDGTNAFATSAESLTANTPLESTLTVSGTTNTGNVNVTIMISAEGTIVYVNQIVAESDGSFSFNFPVSLEAGYTYEVKVNTENSSTASKLYFKTEAASPLHYGDINGDEKVTSADATQIARKDANLTVAPVAAENIVAGLGDLNGDTYTNVNDATLIMRYDAGVPISAIAKERLSWYSK